MLFRSGGYVEYIYAGGGNALNGTTRVTGNVSIAVSGDADVDYVFLAGKNINCYVGTNENNTATLTVSGTAKEMVRISGHNANGSDKMQGIPVLNVETDLRVDYLDYVDKINIRENNLLTVDVLFHHESASAVTVNFVLDGALDEDWEVIGGSAAYDYLQTMTTFQINGTAYARDAETGALGNSGYALIGGTTQTFTFVSLSQN